MIMADATKQAIQYTNQRKKNIDAAEKMETQTTRASLLEIADNDTLTFPTIEERSSKSTASASQNSYKTAEVVVSYSIDKSRLQNAKDTLGNSLMSDSEAGKSTFEYFYSIEVGK